MQYATIDPNVRVKHDNTFTYEPEDIADEYLVGYGGVVVEPESGLMWPAILVEKRLDPKRGDYYMEFDVSWSKGKPIPTGLLG